MKNKTTLVIIAIIGVLITAVFLFWQNGKTIQGPDQTPPKNEMTSATDYTALEKDHLYTEEEGRYENLPEAGKQLLESTLTQPECEESSPTYSGECSNKRKLEFSSLIAFNGGHALLKFPTSKGGYYYKIYDLTKKEFIKNEVDSFAATIRTGTTLILVGINELWKYKVGDSSITKIENSEIQKNETYFRAAGLGYAEVDPIIQDSLLKLSVFSLESPTRDESGGGLTVWEKIREVTFDLNKL